MKLVLQNRHATEHRSRAQEDARHAADGLLMPDAAGCRMHRGRSRPDMTEGCPERLDREFLLYILNFRRAWRQRNASALAGFGGTIMRFGSPAQTEAWLAGL